MFIHRHVLAALVAALISVFSSASLFADTILTPVDLSANVIESILPGGTVFDESKPLFGTTAVPLQSSEILHLSDTGVNASGRSTNISSAFASSLAESDGNGGVGVSHADLRQAERFRRWRQKTGRAIFMDAHVPLQRPRGARSPASGHTDAAGRAAGSGAETHRAQLHRNGRG